MLMVVCSLVLVWGSVERLLNRVLKYSIVLLISSGSLLCVWILVVRCWVLCMNLVVE